MPLPIQAWFPDLYDPTAYTTHQYFTFQMQMYTAQHEHI